MTISQSYYRCRYAAWCCGSCVACAAGYVHTVLVTSEGRALAFGAQDDCECAVPELAAGKREVILFNLWPSHPPHRIASAPTKTNGDPYERSKQM